VQKVKSAIKYEREGRKDEEERTLNVTEHGC
jgi:hypothetical protein